MFPCFSYISVSQVRSSYSGEQLESAKVEIEECKEELVKAKQIRKNKQGTMTSEPWVSWKLKLCFPSYNCIEDVNIPIFNFVKLNTIDGAGGRLLMSWHGGVGWY